MNTTKARLAVVGGIAAVAVLATGYFTWNAYSKMQAALEGSEGGDDEEAVEVKPGLMEVLGQAKDLTDRADAIFPCPGSVVALKTNEAAVTEWKAEALRLASRGDRKYKPMTASELKSFFESDAKRIAALPGGVLIPGLPETKLIKPTFQFGPFEGFVIKGEMPPEDPAKVVELQRQWDDFATVAEELSKCGVVELVNVGLSTPKAEEAPQPRKGMRKKTVKAKEADRKSPIANTYVFSFTTRPAGFVRVVNALATCERFMIVDDFSFIREKDVIAAAFGGETAKAEERQSARGRRGRRRSEVPAKDVEKKGNVHGDVITDPQLDPPIVVNMTVTVYDFRSMEEEEVSK